MVGTPRWLHYCVCIWLVFVIMFNTVSGGHSKMITLLCLYLACICYNVQYSVWWALQDDYATVFVTGLYLCFDGWKFGSNSVTFVVISAGIMGQFYVLFGFCCKITCGQLEEYNGLVLFNKVRFQCFPYEACIIYTELWFRDKQKANKLLGGYFLLKGKTLAVSYQNGLLFLSFPSCITKANVKYTIRDFNLRHKLWC